MPHLGFSLICRRGICILCVRAGTLFSLHLIFYYAAIVWSPSCISFDWAALFSPMVRPDDPSKPRTHNVHIIAILVHDRRLTFYATRIHTGRLLLIVWIVVTGEPFIKNFHIYL